MNATPPLCTVTADLRLRVVAQLAAAPNSPITQTLEAMRSLLGMDMACVTDTRGGRHGVLAVSGDAQSFGVHIGVRVEPDGTYCGELHAGRIDGLITDTRRDPRVKHLAGDRANGDRCVHRPADQAVRRQCLWDLGLCQPSGVPALG